MREHHGARANGDGRREHSARFDRHVGDCTHRNVFDTRSGRADRLADGHQILGRWVVALTASERLGSVAIVEVDEDRSCDEFRSHHRSQ